ncbi:putative carboxylesterase 16 [Iris pallida]|uniref:Carboxylesterase 16 n=1 Tax=Iris pallida TaxID=29817 RepID=A0AAX6EWP0_IRIPA|nr:putative carboxylesterase 16 [Iris pallida]
MPSVAVKLYSVYFKLILKHKLQAQIHSVPSSSDPFGVTSRPEEPSAPSNPSFSSADGVATKDIHIDPLTSLSVRIFLPDSSLLKTHRRSSFNGGPNPSPSASPSPSPRRSSYEPGSYRGYLPDAASARRLPVILQFHGGAFVSGSNVSAANDLFCRRIAKVMDVIVVAVGYRLAPESRYPAAFEDGLKVHWLGKQANLAECRKSLGGGGAGGGGGGVGERKGGPDGGSSTRLGPPPSSPGSPPTGIPPDAFSLA